MTQPPAGHRPSPGARLARLLESPAGTWPAPIEHHETLGSTNDRLRELADEDAPEWTVVVADRQTTGRGRAGRVWASPVGNLYLSVLLRPRLPVDRVTLLPLVAGLAVAEAVSAFGVNARIKWPNDVLVGGRKLAGVLAEATSVGGAVELLVLGVGVNVAGQLELLPPEIRSRSTSLAEQTQRPEDPIALAAKVLERLGVWYHALARDAGQRMLSEWRRRSVAWWGRRVQVQVGSSSLRGIARGLDARGALEVETEDGTIRRVVSGDAQELRLAPEQATEKP
jgi:BirA family biotin operon repressor/biotin-[acetyl-CoA-carboxylase] ligase